MLQPSPQRKRKSTATRSISSTATKKSAGNRTPKSSKNYVPQPSAKPLPVLPWNRSDEETNRISEEEVKKFFAPRRAEPKEKIDPAVVEKFYNNLLKPETPLVPDYERQILKADARRRRETESSSREAPQKTVPMLGEQENQSCAPLQVFDTRDAPPVNDYEAELQRKANEMGMTYIAYLNVMGDNLPKCDANPIQPWKYGKNLVKKEELKNLPTKMRKLHKWYLDFCKTRKEEWITAHIRDQIFLCGDDEIDFNIQDLHFLFNQKELDKAAISLYCV